MIFPRPNQTAKTRRLKVRQAVVCAGSLLVVVTAGLFILSVVPSGPTDGCYSRFGSAVGADLLISATGIRRQPNAMQEDGVTPYPTYQIVGVRVLARAKTRLTDSGLTSNFPELMNPQRVSGHSLSGVVAPVPDFEGMLLAGLYVTHPDFELVGVPPWHVGWVARVRDDGDVTIYEGCKERWDPELSELANILGRHDQAQLLIDWATESLAVRKGGEPGPIMLAYESTLPPEPPPPPSIAVPILVIAEGVESPEVGETLDTLNVEPASLDDSYLPTEIFLDDPPWPTTALMYAGDRMVIEIWDDGQRVVRRTLAPTEWEPIVASGGGVIARVTLDSSGIYSLTVEVLNQADFDEVVSDA